MNNILVTLDGSQLAESVLPYVLTIAKGFNSKLTLLNVVDSAGVNLFEYDEFGDMSGDWGTFEELEKQAEESSRSYLDGQAKRLKELGVETDTLIEHGHTSDVIMDYVESHSPDLVAMSTHGRSGIGRFLLGSVTNRVLRHSKTPVLVVRPREEMTDPIAPLTDIIIPLDASKLSEAVLPVARGLAKTLGLKVTLVAVLPTASQLYIGTEIVVYPSNAIERFEAAMEEYLKTTAERIIEEDGLNVEWDTLHGEPGTAIVDYAGEEFQNNLIAMSTHGRSGLGRWLLGSVTDQVVRASGDPVLVVRCEES